MALIQDWMDAKKGVPHKGIYLRVVDLVWQVREKKVTVIMVPFSSKEHADKAGAEGVDSTPWTFAVSDTPAVLEPEVQPVGPPKMVQREPATYDYTRFFGPDVWAKGGTNPVRQAYLAVKEHPLFRDATDVLETETKALTATATTTR